MNSSELSLVAVRLPTLLIYVAAIVVCIIFWRRAPRGAMFALFGIVLFFATSLLSIASTLVLMRNRKGTSAVSLSQVMMIFQVTSMLLHAGGVALLVVGVFAGREVPQGAGFEVQRIGQLMSASTAQSISRPPSPPPPPLPPLR